MSFDYTVVGEQLLVISKPTGLNVYDFDFRRFFDCKSHTNHSDPKPAAARVGAIPNYQSFSDELAEADISLIHTVAEHDRCSLLPCWYPLLQHLTPKSKWYEVLPDADAIERDFAYPVFIKGERQTSRHRADLTIARNRAELERVLHQYKNNRILRWQRLVVRELMNLRKIEGNNHNKVPFAFEFRTFWWRKELVGAGPYWIDAPKYNWNELERVEALKVAREAAGAVDCGFVAIDLAQTSDGRWIVIECNDAMESGYAGISPVLLWQNVLEAAAD